MREPVVGHQSLNACLYQCAESDRHSSIPVPRAKRGPRRWQVELGADGLLLGASRPPPSHQVRGGFPYFTYMFDL